ncbi:malectin domain-containing carbohydrate-binding protein [Poritiphilus flavus]|uniref:T9SS type A sorting domain-containing protein n=1 Tax=Poritiphilus flavus TaxID=2697053 RepID=A0A6L9EH54_9FLAO|nr:malectin domain-containing carbohydrate-binding protein [Poritiphilus flavus]NAS14031.1 T9SS type A sorting domain-containing protein [Poritiphilus flavus]
MKNFTFSAILIFLFSFQIYAQHNNASNLQEKTLPPLTCDAPIDPAWLLAAEKRILTTKVLEESTVRVAYLIPSNRTPQAKGVEALQLIIRTGRDFFKKQMAHNGLPPKTFRYETKADGETPLIHVVHIPETDAQIEGNSDIDAWNNKISAAINAGLGVWQRGEIWILVSETHMQQPNSSIIAGGALGASFGNADDPGVATMTSTFLTPVAHGALTDNRPYDGMLIPEIGPYPLKQSISFHPGDRSTMSSIASVTVGAFWHELMHAFGIGHHDFRNDANFHGNLMGNGFRGVRGHLYPKQYPNDYTRLAFASAQALNTNHYFNTGKQRNRVDNVSFTLQSNAPQDGKLVFNITASDSDGLSMLHLFGIPGYSVENVLSGTSFNGQITIPYFNPGIMTDFRLKLYDKEGNKVENTVEVTPATGINRAPWPYMRFIPPIGETGDNFSLDAGHSRDPDSNTPLSFEWDFNNDGVYDTPPDQSSLTTVNLPGGNHLIRLRLTDPSGAQTVSTPMALHVSGETPPQSDITFTLINADTDEDLFDLKDGMQIDIDKLPTLHLDIRANTSTDVESVELSITSSGNVQELNNIRTESLLPYAFFQDLPIGDYMGATFFDADFTISAVPYSQDNLGGVAGTPVELTFEIAGYCQEATDRSIVEAFDADCNGEGGHAILITTLAISDEDAPNWERDEHGDYVRYHEPGTYEVTVGNEPGCTRTIEYTIGIDPNNCPPGGFQLRINTGGSEIDYNGDTFMADSYFDTGRTLVRPQTGLPEPYQSFRFSPSQQMSYNIPVPDGEYTVNLHFAELWFGATGGGTGGVGKRVFDVNIEGQLAEDNLDVYAEVGAEAILVKSHTVTVTDGAMSIDFSSLDVDGGERHPIINAIEILGETIGPVDPIISSLTLILDDGFSHGINLTESRVMYSGCTTCNSRFVANVNEGVGSVHFELKGRINLEETINDVPGDSQLFFEGSDYILPPGAYTLTATPYSAANKGGAMGQSITANFNAQDGIFTVLRITDATSCTSADGSAIILTGGSIPDNDATWSHDPLLRGPFAADLAPGNYRVTIHWGFIGSSSDVVFDYEIKSLDGEDCPDTNDFVLRINTGGSEVEYKSEAFMADSYFDMGRTLVRPQTGLPEPYQSFRFSPSQQMSYNIPVPDGEYTVNLHFAELWFGATGGGSPGIGRRVFDVSIEGELKEDNLDIYSLVGSEAMLVRTHNVTVTDGAMSIDFSSLDVDGGERHPIINAIEILGKTIGPVDPIISNLTLILDDGSSRSINLTGSRLMYSGCTTCNSRFVANVNEGVGSVHFELKGRINLEETINDVPGDSQLFFEGSDYILPPGAYTLTATPYSAANKGGAMGQSITANFNAQDGIFTVLRITDATSCTSADGSAIILTGGSIPDNDATWSHDPLLRGPFAADLAPGNYRVTIHWGFIGSSSDVVFDYEIKSLDGEDCPDTNDFVLRINTGGSEVEYKSEAFMADSYFDTGRTLVRPQTGLPEPYQSFRFSPSQQMSYNIPVPDGEYTVNLHFAELWFGATGGGLPGIGRRVFDVSIEGELKEDNLDVYSLVGSEAMLVRTHNVTVSGGVLDIDFSSLTTDGGVRHPIINAIEILGSNNGAPAKLASSKPISDNTMRIAPNPVMATTSLNFEKPVQLLKIQVFDVMGRLVRHYTDMGMSANSTYLLNTGELPPGTYFINSYDVQGNRYQKQIVVKR